MIGVGLPQVRDNFPVRADELTAFARAAEEVGADSVWVAEAPWTQPSLDPLSTLALAASCSTRLGLGTAVLVPLDHSPMPFARTVAGIDVLSDGRLTLGVGVGAPSTENPEPARERAERFEGLVGELRRAWSSGCTGGPHGQVLGIRPVRGSIPMVIGARARPALRRAARIGDGWVCSAWADIDRFVAQRAVVDAERLALGREGTGFRYIKRCYVAVEQREQHIESWFRTVSGGGAPEGSVLVRGSADAVEVQLRRLRESGADELILQFVGVEELRQLETFAESGALRRLADQETGET